MATFSYNGLTFSNKLFQADNDQAYFLKKLIAADQFELNTHKKLRASFDIINDSWNFDVHHQIILRLSKQIRFRKNALREQRRRRANVNTFIMRLVNKGLISNLYLHGVQDYVELRHDFVYVKKLVDRLYSLIMKQKVKLEFVRESFDYKHQNIYLGLEYEEQRSYDSEDEYQEEDANDVIRHEKYVFYNSLRDEFDVSEMPNFEREEEWEFVRNPNYLLKLHRIIEAFKNMRTRIQISFQKKYRSVWDYLKDNPVEADIPLEPLTLKEYHAMPEDPMHSIYDPTFGAFAKLELGVEPQMDKEGKEGDCDLIKEDQKENVILTSHAEESVAKPISIVGDNWEQLCSSQSYQSYDIMKRWKKYKILSWTKDQPQNSLLLNSKLPIDFIKSMSNTPNGILFKTYTYCKFDMELKVQVNSNKFHAGQLQASFYYGATSDKFYDDRKHVACASQMTHCIIDAAAASDGKLLIPFRYYKPLLSTRQVKDDENVMDIGTFRLFVLNPLLVPVNDVSGVDVTIFFRFVNPRFHGMVDRSLGTFLAADFVEPQMFSPSGLKKVVKGADAILNQIFPDDQRDNPTDPSAPMIMNPQNSQSWCVGDVLSEKINVMRLQADGTTPHPPGTLPKEPEMDLDYIKSIYGLVKTINWRISDQEGSILLKIPFSPILGTEDYFKININNGQARDCEIMPPVSILSSLFAYWRGSIDYRLDFVSTQFHTGRLLVAYVPRISGNITPTLEQLTCCDHIIMDLRTNKQYQFINRFLSDKPWWPRRYGNANSTESYPPGYIYFAILNRLTATPAVSSSIAFNLYMRGAQDFELHIPVAPQIGLSNNTQVIQRHSHSETYEKAYGPPQEQIYVGGWHTLNAKLGKGQVAMFRYGPGSDHVTQFRPKTELKHIRAVYRLLGAPGDITFINTSGFTVNANYMVLVPPIYELSSTKYWYGLAFNSPNAAAKYAKSIKVDPQNKGFYLVDYSLMSVSAADGSYSGRSDDIYWEAIVNDSDDYEVIESQMEDERKFVCGDQVSIHPPLNSTWNGLLTFGEQITNIKQLLRRYQPYCAINLPQSNLDPSLADVRIPLLPQGLNLDLTLDYCNQNREGIIPILLSGYRFYRGGMRLRFVVSDNSKNSKHFWVQHKCDEKLNSLEPITTLDASDSNNRLTSGYATYLQNLDMNSVVSIEIPFYLPGQFGLLQRPSLTQQQDSPHYSLGNLYCGVDYGAKSGTQSMNTQIIGFYSLSDDFSASVFQGYPPVFRLVDFVTEPQMEEEKKSEDKGKSSSSSWFSLSTLRKSMQNSVAGLANDLIEEKKQEWADKMNVDGNINGFLNAITDTMDEGKKMVVLAALSNVFHAIINPSVSTLAWSIASFFLTLGVVSFDMLFKVFEYFKRTVSKLFCKKSSSSQSEPRCETDDSGKVESQSPEDFDDAAFASTIVAGALALMKSTHKPLPKNLPDFSKYMYEGLPKFTLSANGLFTFFKNNINLLKRVFHWVVSYIRPEATLYSEIEEGEVDIIAYVKKIQWCLDAQNERRIQTELASQYQVYLCANIAQILLAKMCVSKIEKPMPVFTRYLHKIISLRDKLAREFASPPVRYEPFVLGIVGPSKIGKSHMANRIGGELIKSIGYKTYEELVYVRTPGNPYWNNLYNQPVCLFDDFLCLQDPQFGLTQVAELFCLKSTAVFNPSKAVLEEKNIRYNPLVVMLCSNIAFPVVHGVTSNEALWRRRDILVMAQAKKAYIGKNPRMLPKEVKENYDHLEFRIYADSTKDEFIKEKGKDLVFSFGELNSYLVKSYHQYHLEECAAYQKRMGEMQAHFPEIIDSFGTIQDNLDALEKWANNRFGNEVDISDLKRKTMIGGAATPILRKIESIKKDFVQKPDEVYLAGARPPTIPDENLIEVEVLIESQAPLDDLDVEDCRCIKESLLMSNNLSAGDVMIITDTDMFSLGNCCSDCVFQNTVSKKRKIQYAMTVRDKWVVARRPLDRLPESIRILLGMTETAAEILGQVEVEIEESSAWYRKWLNSLPSFCTVMRFLGKFLALIGMVYGLFKGCSSLFNLPSTLKTAANNSEADLNYSKAVAHDASNVNSTVVKLWEEDRPAMELSVKEMFCGKSVDQMPASGTSQTPGASKTHPSLIKAFVTSQAESELQNVVYGKIKRNNFWFLVEYLDEVGNLKSMSLRCLGLAGRYALMLDHYYSYMKSKVAAGAKIYFVCANSIIPLSLESINVSVSRSSALYIIKLPLNIPCFYNIIKFFAPSHTHSNLGPSATLVETCYDVKRNDTYLNLHKFARITKREKLVINNDDSSQTLVDCVYVYPKSERGLCGSILVSAGNIVKPIIGIHVAGVKNGMSGYSESLNYESFEWIVDEVISASDHAISQMGCDDPQMLPDTNVKFIGVVPSELSSSPPIKSRLILTECAGEITPINMDIPVLSPQDPRIQDNKFSPLYEGIRNHGLVPLDFPNQEVFNAYRDLREQLLTCVIPQRLDVGVLSVEQSVIGIPNIPSYESLDMLTSEGFPFTKLRPSGATNKSWLFDIDYTMGVPRLNKIENVLVQCLNDKQKMREQGIIPNTIFTACLKDAKMPKSKVLIPGKTRIFSISPVDFTIQQRQYFLDFAVSYQEARFSAEHAVGIDIKSMEVTQMLDKLFSNSQFFLTGDYSKFGDQLMSSCVYYAYQIIVDWYTHNGDHSRVNARVRKVFCEEVMHALILAKNTVYQNFCGMPSGNSLTVIINSLVNSMYTRIVWQLIMKDCNPKLYPLSEYHKFVIPVFYGDDLFMSVKEEVLDYYNVETMSKKFSEFGIKFTDSSKSDRIVKFSKIFDPSTTFLKHSFHNHPNRFGIWIAKLDDLAAKEICNWTWNTIKNIRESSLVACTSMLEEMYGHGETEYEEIRTKVISYWQNKNVIIKIPSWYEMDIRIFGV